MSTPKLSLTLFGRYTRANAFESVGIEYDQEQRHLNVGLSPQCNDGGYFIFVTLNKDEFDPAHNYADYLVADQFIWVTRRGVTPDKSDYVNLMRPETRVSLFVRTNPREPFVYAGELEYADHKPFRDPSSDKPQILFVWRLKNPLPDYLLQELTFGLRPAKEPESGKTKPRSPSSFDELKKAYGYVLGTAERLVVPEHQNYQVRLKAYLEKRNLKVEMERNFIDVSFSLEDADFIGEIKVTRNLSLPQAFRSALGQLLDYEHAGEGKSSSLVMFLDQPLDQRRLSLAADLKMSVVVSSGDKFILQNPATAPSVLKDVFDAS